MQDLRQWLERLGLPQYEEVFAENDVDLEALRLLTEGDLEKLGVSLGHRRKLLKALSELSGSLAPPPTGQPIQEGQPPRESISAQAERRQLTVLFCDLVGSTALAQKLDPEELRDLMQAYQRACGQVIARYDGHVAQYLGDGLVVYFGWPRAHEDDAARAIRAGLEVVEAVSRLTSSTAISVRVGIHTGLVVVGQTGDGDASVPKAAVGETPNIAARLTALAEPNCVVVSERTGSLARGLFDYTDLGAQRLKGLTEPVRLHRVLGTRVVDNRFDASRGGAALTPIVGRESEMAVLLRGWAQAKMGEGQVVLVRGEPGIGKSRLARILREQIAGEARAIVRYQCSPFHVNSPLYPIITQIEQAAEFNREDSIDQKLDKLEALLSAGAPRFPEAVPLCAALLTLPTDRYPTAGLSPRRKKEKTLNVLEAQLEMLAEPALIVFEDVQWIDPTSQELLDMFIPRLRTGAILLVITHRPEYGEHWTGQRHVTNLSVDRLARHHAAQLVGELAASKALPPELLDQILAHTDGVPLFVEELTKSVLESQLLTEPSDRYVLPPVTIPTTLRDSLIARLDRLAPSKEVAQLGACIGREFSYELLAAIWPGQGAQLVEALEKLSETGMVFRTGTPPGATYSFKHALVQDAAYDSLLKSTRQQLHGKIARALLERFPAVCTTQPEIVAHHYTAAGQADVAVVHWRRAGELALGRVALREAIAHLSKGLELTCATRESPTREVEELALRTLLGTAWVGLRGWSAPEVKSNFGPAFELAKVLDHRPSYLPVLHGLYSHDVNRGRVGESLKWVRELQEIAEALDDKELRITGYRLAQNTHFYLGHLPEAQHYGERIAAQYDADQGRRIERLTNLDPLTARGVWGALSLWLLGYPDQALRLHEDTVAHARSHGRPFGLCWALTAGSGVFEFRGEPDEQLIRLDEADRLGQLHSIPLFSDVFVPMFRAIAQVHGGRTSEGIPQLRNALGKWNSLGGHISTPYLKAVLAEGIAQSGNLEQGLALIAECLEQIERPGWEERWSLAEVLRLKGWMLGLQGNLNEAEQSVRAAVDVAREQLANSWELRASMTLARLLSVRGERKDARDVLAKSYRSFTEGFGTRDLKEAKALLEELS